jgi:hypothetical protein
MQMNHEGTKTRREEGKKGKRGPPQRRRGRREKRFDFALLLLISSSRLTLRLKAVNLLFSSLCPLRLCGEILFFLASWFNV